MLEIDSTFRARMPVDADFGWFMGLSGEVFRDMPDRKTLRFELDGKNYFIKRHDGVGWREIFKNLFQGRLPVIGAKNEYLAIRRLNQLGVETMNLVAYGSRGWNPARRRSFVVTEELADTISLEDYCASWPLQPPSPRLKRALIHRVAEMAKTLHENGVNHRDFYLCHFLLQLPVRSTVDFHLYLIDLHRVQIRARTPVRWRVKDLAAVYFSSMDFGITRGDRLRFLRAYSGRPLRSVLAAERAFWAKVERKALQLHASWNDPAHPRSKENLTKN